MGTKAKVQPNRLYSDLGKLIRWILRHKKHDLILNSCKIEGDFFNKNPSTSQKSNVIGSANRRNMDLFLVIASALDHTFELKCLPACNRREDYFLVDSIHHLEPLLRTNKLRLYHNWHDLQPQRLLKQRLPLTTRRHPHEFRASGFLEEVGAG